METSKTKDKRLILKVNCSPMKLGGFSLTRMHSLRKDLINLKMEDLKKRKKKGKGKKKEETENSSVSLSTNITKNRPGKSSNRF